VTILIALILWDRRNGDRGGHSGVEGGPSDAAGAAAPLRSARLQPTWAEFQGRSGLPRRGGGAGGTDARLPPAGLAADQSDLSRGGVYAAGYPAACRHPGAASLAAPLPP